MYSSINGSVHVSQYFEQRSPVRLGETLMMSGAVTDVTPVPKGNLVTSRFELARQFRALYGTSPYRYLLMRRLASARDALTGHASLAEVALAAGFADQAHFTRMFKSAFGLTPARPKRRIDTSFEEA